MIHRGSVTIEMPRNELGPPIRLKLPGYYWLVLSLAGKVVSIVQKSKPGRCDLVAAYRRL